MIPPTTFISDGSSKQGRGPAISRYRSGYAVLLSFSALLGAPGLHAQSALRSGSEFQVNTYTTSAQRYPAIGADRDGDFVVTWMSLGQDGDGNGIFARRFNSSGVSQGAAFQVNIHTVNNQRYPAVGMDGDGNFVVAWRDVQQDGDSYAVIARRYDAAGVALTGEFLINTYTVGPQWFPSLAMKGNGDFVVSWESLNQDGDSYGVIARRFSSSGSAQGGELQVNTYTTGNQRFPAVAIDADGDFVVTWQSLGQDGAYNGIFAQRFNSAGSRAGAEFQVNTYTLFFQLQPDVALDADGDFVIAWESYHGGAAGFDIAAQRFNSAGAAVAAEFQVNSFTGYHQRNATVAIRGDGNFVMAWDSNAQDGYHYGVFARRFNAAGIRQASEFQVNTYTTRNQRIPVVRLDGEGDFIVAWQSTLQDGNEEGVFAQRFVRFDTLDVDGNGSITPLTDGLLVLRFHFGFTGSTLTSSAVGGGCTRCDAASITPYLTGLGSVLDIDGSGAIAPLSDGLLVLRFIFGFTGATLTTGAVDSVACTRCDAATIVPYLQKLI